MGDPVPIEEQLGHGSSDLRFLLTNHMVLRMNTRGSYTWLGLIPSLSSLTSSPPPRS